MKKVLLLALVIVCGVAFSDSFAKKPKKAASTETEQAAVDSLRMKREREELELQRKLDSLKMAVMEAEMKRPRGPLPYDDIEEMPLPCQEEAQSNDEYYCALGISRERQNSSIAVQDAMQKAQLELAQMIGGESVELNNVEVVCRQILRDPRGNFIAYVAIRMPKKQ